MTEATVNTAPETAPETDTKSVISREESEAQDRADGQDAPATAFEPESAPSENGESVDYEELIASDLNLLRSEFPELKDISDITELDNPIRYAALRDLGLDPAEAYMATAKRVKRDNRAHLTAAYGKSAVTPGGMMSQRELAEARELFGNLSDSEIQRLYRKVTT